MNQPGQRIMRCANGVVEIELDTLEVKKAGEDVNLSRTEGRLLDVLVSRAPHDVRSSEILAFAARPEPGHDAQYLRMWISRLRAKIEPEPNEPQVVRNANEGYFLLPDFHKPSVSEG
jgi:two-component system, OmpR family, KDP operon response regulator KdpE